MKRSGNCYVTCEALYHLMGGSKSGWKPMHMFVFYGNGWSCSHWFLQHKKTGVILDPTVKQFKKKPNYEKGRGCGFLTKQPSRRAKELMPKILWAEKQ